MEQQTKQTAETIKELGTAEVPVPAQSKYHFISNLLIVSPETRQFQKLRLQFFQLLIDVGKGLAVPVA